MGRIILLPAEMIAEVLIKIKENLLEKFPENLRGLIIYGSWVKGTARADSDIDLLAIFQEVDSEVISSLSEVEQDFDYRLVIVPCSLEEFKREKLPLYTAIKKEGKIIYGEIDLSLNTQPPEVKYLEFFKKSREFETHKVEIAAGLLEKDVLSGVADLCFIASKHTIQAALAMKGEGFSSKLAILMPLAEKYFSKEIVAAFKKLFELYVKSEYGLELIAKEEAQEAIEKAKSILEIYNSVQ